jgi:replicative DNA helicase
MDGDVGTLMDIAEQRMLAVRESSGKEDNMKSLSSHVAEAIDSIQYMLEHPGQLRGLSTGYSVRQAQLRSARLGNVRHRRPSFDG